MADESDRRTRRSGATGLAIPGGLLIGLGIGLLTDNVAAGLLIGIGCGFVVMGVLRVLAGDW